MTKSAVIYCKKMKIYLNNTLCRSTLIVVYFLIAFFQAFPQLSYTQNDNDQPHNKASWRQLLSDMEALAGEVHFGKYTTEDKAVNKLGESLQQSICTNNPSLVKAFLLPQEYYADRIKEGFDPSTARPPMVYHNVNQVGSKDYTNYYFYPLYASQDGCSKYISGWKKNEDEYQLIFRYTSNLNQSNPTEKWMENTFHYYNLCTWKYFIVGMRRNSQQNWYIDHLYDFSLPGYAADAKRQETFGARLGNANHETSSAQIYYLQYLQHISSTTKAKLEYDRLMKQWEEYKKEQGEVPYRFQEQLNAVYGEYQGGIAVIRQLEGILPAEELSLAEQMYLDLAKVFLTIVMNTPEAEVETFRNKYFGNIAADQLAFNYYLATGSNKVKLFAKTLATFSKDKDLGKY